MKTKTTKFLIIISFIIMIITLLFSTCVRAYTGNPLSLNSDVGLTNKFEQGFYCMNHGMHYHAKTFYVYEVGTVSDLERQLGVSSNLLSFVLGEAIRAEEQDVKFEGKGSQEETIDGNNLRTYEPWQNYVWHIFGNAGYTQLSQPIPDTYKGLEDKFAEYVKIWNQVIKNGENPLNIVPVSPTGTDLSTYVDPTNPAGLKTDEVLVADSTNRVKLKVEYPWNEKLNEYYGNIFTDGTNIPGLLNLVEIKILVNGVEFYDSTYNTSVNNKLQNANGEPFKIGDKEAYINVADLNYGEEASIKVEWNFVHYTEGQYSKLTPYRELKLTYYCENERSYTYDVTMNNYKINGNWQIRIPNTYYMPHKHLNFVANPSGSGLVPKLEDCSETRLLLKGYDYDTGSNSEKGGEYQDILYMETTPEILKLEKELKIFIGQPNIKLLLDKIDSITSSKVTGVKFEVSAINGNIVLEDGSIVNPYTIVTTNSDTVIEIKPNNNNGLVNEITAVFDEVELLDEDEYLIYKDTLEVTFVWDSTTSEWKYKEIKVPTYENEVKEIAEVFDIEKNIWKLTAENRPGIEELSGFVWIDEVTGEKNIQVPNGIYDLTERFKAGVKVYLYKTDGTRVEYDGYGERFGTGGEGYVVTNDNGVYEFKNLPKLDGESYYIVFEYDGINYICTTPNKKPNSGLDSKADETDRTGFNSRFKTISAGQSNDGTKLTYSYDGKASTLITENRDGTVREEFAIEADTKTAGNLYNETTTDINLGISKKVVDLALMTDLHQATASINGIKKTLPYNTKFDNDMNAILDVMQDITADGVEYNINLYRSDYNYRIGQYVNSPSIAHQPSLAPEEQTVLQNSRAELEVILEYIVILANQSTTDASVDEFEFYYDSHLQPINVTGGIVLQDSGNKLTITPSNASVGFGEYREVKLEFKAVNLSDEQTVKNYAEITKYSTDEGGYVDCDSAPGNANIGGAMQYEDDTDEARGVNLRISRTDREISGYVFEDKKEVKGDAPEYITGNGVYDNGETPVDDVIVQLIEIKELEIGNTKHRLEYIWQETTSGSNVVKRISDDGTQITTIQYQDVTPETGKYVFRNFIPGDYIVRFIYGDGTYKDTAINQANILKYNGQDYKSTLDENYSSKYFIPANYSSENSSVARDNEARRLEVMAYALGAADGKDLIIDSMDKLTNTWMAAETSKMIVEDTMIDGVSTFYRKANFGLVARPETKLSLKKHIMSAELKDATGKTIVQAGVPDVGSQYLDNSTEIVDFRNGISVENAPIEATATTRSNRGYWQVEANDVDGAELMITYKYIVTNIGEPDYLSQELVNKFKFTGAYDTDILNYRHEIEKCAEEVKKAIKTNPDSYSLRNTYLGQAYYTGKKASSSDNQRGGDANVKTYVNLEDYLGELTFDGSAQFEAVGTENKKIIDKSGNEATEDVKVIRTKIGEAITNNSVAQFEVKVKGVIADKKTFPSYIAQIITPITSLSGTKITGSTPNNLEYVQSHYSVARLDDLGLGKGTEIDEFWAETFRIVPTTGEDKQSNFMLVISITAGLVVIAVGVIVIKKFMMK